MQNEIRIEDFNEFIKDKEEVRTLLDRGANDINELSVNVKYIDDNLKTVKERLNSLKNVKVDTSAISSLNNLNSTIENLNNDYTEKMGRIVFGQEMAVILIETYNTGKYSSEKIFSEYSNVMQTVSDTTVFWITNGIIKSQQYDGLFKMWNDKATNMVKDSNIPTEKIMQTMLQDTGMKRLTKTLLETFPGSLVVGLYEAGKGYVLDQGDVLPKDSQRIVITSITTAANYFAYNYISENIAASIGGSVGGPVGVAVAIGATFAIRKVSNYTKDQITGDIIVDSFKSADGKEYSIPRNGSGKNGTYDVILENYQKVKKKKKIDGVEYSESNYKKILYNDFENVAKGSRSLYGDEVDLFKKDLETLKSIDNVTEAKEYISNMQNKYSTESRRTNEMQDLYPTLQKFDFDLEEYYKYYHPQSTFD